MKCAATAAVRGVVDRLCRAGAAEIRPRVREGRTEGRGGRRCTHSRRTTPRSRGGRVRGEHRRSAVAYDDDNDDDHDHHDDDDARVPGGGRQVSDRAGVEHCWYLGQAGRLRHDLRGGGPRLDPATRASGGAGRRCRLPGVIAEGRPSRTSSSLLISLSRPSEDCSASGVGGLGCFDKPVHCRGFCDPHSYGRCATPTTDSAASAPDSDRFCACQ